LTIVIVEIVFIFLLILANGILALSEIALVSARKARLQQRAETGDHKAAAALVLAQSPDTFLATVQIGITLVGVLAGAVGGATVAEKIEEWLSRYAVLAPYGEVIGVGVVVIVITYFSLVLGELVPKRIALGNPEQLASVVARPMQLLARAASPFVRFLGASTNLSLRVLRVRPSIEPPVTEEEIKFLVESGTRAGVFEPAERDLVSRVFKLGDRTVGELMTPRGDVVWLDVADPASVLGQTIAGSHHSRFPVCQGSQENVLGVVAARDLLRQSLAGEEVNVQAVVEQPLFVPESTRALEMLRRFKESRTHFALVVDEHGSVIGICTLFDIMEAIVGTLPTHDEPTGAAIVQRDDGSWLVDGALPFADFREHFRLTKLPEEKGGAYRTVGGFVMEMLRRVPAEGDQIEFSGLRIEVVDMDGRRVDKVLVRRLREGSHKSRV
jgi:putative hemolysin